ncbi:MAG: 3-(3-hydroxy-phenyl)propionate hydroxylase [Hyphomicrobiaceae bacterium]|jgi:3-(3-hydroxy-phenyl)propionate hydroxylase
MTAHDSDSPAPQRLPTKVDVLIVGLGPVGATLANLLAQQSVNTLIIDKADDILMAPRAIGLDNEAQRILQMAGLADDAFEKLAIRECRLLSPWFGEFARFATTGVIDGYAPLITFYQPDLERALRHRLATCDTVQMATGMELVSFTDGGESVTATLRLRDGSTTEVEARYLIGADGASSMVRRAIGQEFSGHSYGEDWLIIDTRNSTRSMQHIEFHCHRDGARPHIPAPGSRERWEFMLGPEQTAEQTPEQILSDVEVSRLLAPWGDSKSLEIERRAIYRFHARCCENFRKGNVFLVGDAAHITPPFAGQGLVSGLRDAANLAWKLAFVLQGRVGSTVLDSYDVERRPHAKAMIDLARFVGSVIMPNNRAKAFVIHALFRGLRLFGPIRRYFDELKVKPAPAFREGLFATGKERLRRGAWIPQVLLRTPNGDTILSDEALGDRVTLVGFGTDPRVHLDAATLAKWEAIGGGIVEIASRSQAVDRSADAYEDLTGELVPGTAPPGWAAIIRPDRTILHDGPVADSARLIAESCTLLGATKPSSTTDSVISKEAV